MFVGCCDPWGTAFKLLEMKYKSANGRELSQMIIKEDLGLPIDQLDPTLYFFSFLEFLSE
jgi:hypothetical protein